MFFILRAHGFPACQKPNSRRQQGERAQQAPSCGVRVHCLPLRPCQVHQVQLTEAPVADGGVHGVG